MPPRTRYAAIRSLKEDYQARLQFMRAGPVNITGFCALPTELLLAIISHYPTVPIPSFVYKMYSKHYLEQSEVLRVLSQTCHSLRNIFLPLLWQKIEVCANPRKGPLPAYKNKAHHMWEKDLATELVRQLEIVTVRDPSLAPYVKIVNVHLTNFSSDTVIEELVRCLQLFSNLHTIQILGRAGIEIRKSLRHSLRGVSLPSVQTVAANIYCAEPLLSACQQARYLTITHECSEYQLGEIRKTLPNVERLRGFSAIDYSKTLPKMIKTFRKTRHFIFYVANPTLTMDVIRQSLEFPDLTTIELNVGDYKSENKKAAQPERLALFEKPVLKFMRDHPTFAARQEAVGKRLIVTHHGIVRRSYRV